MIRAFSTSRSGLIALTGLALTVSMISAPGIAAQGSTSWSSGWSNRESFILIRGGGDGSFMHGSSDDLRAVHSLRAGKEPLLYFRRGGKSYVIRDAALLRQAEAIVKPQQELGVRQGELGRRQGELGRRQGALGAKQGALGRQQAAAARRHVTGGRADAAREQAALGRQQGELGRQQAELGRQQAELGRQQAALGAEQARLAQLAQPKISALLDEALRRGLALQVN